MSRSLFDSDVPHPEPSNLTAFAANDLIRDSEHRDESSVDKALAKEGTHIFAFSPATSWC
jgi:NAD+ diphosphatase